MGSGEQVTYDRESAFHALGLADADDLKLRAELLRTIAAVIRERGLTQKAAGELMEMDQPRVSALLAGKITRFSTDRLIRALRDLGRDVEVRILPATGRKGELRVAA
jgi:predicted XRE-type DNA-binding protein